MAPGARRVPYARARGGLGAAPQGRGMPRMVPDARSRTRVVLAASAVVAACFPMGLRAAAVRARAADRILRRPGLLRRLTDNGLRRRRVAVPRVAVPRGVAVRVTVVGRRRVGVLPGCRGVAAVPSGNRTVARRAIVTRRPRPKSIPCHRGHPATAAASGRRQPIRGFGRGAGPHCADPYVAPPHPACTNRRPRAGVSAMPDAFLVVGALHSRASPGLPVVPGANSSGSPPGPAAPRPNQTNAPRTCGASCPLQPVRPAAAPSPSRPPLPHLGNDWRATRMPHAVPNHPN